MNSIKRENLELRSTITETENSLEGLKSMFRQKNQQTDSNWFKSTEITYSEEQGGKRKRKEKIMKKINTPVGYLQVYQHIHYGSSRERESREKDRKNIWRNNGSKLPKFDENHKSHKSKKLSEFQDDKCNVIHTETHEYQTTKSQR